MKPKILALSALMLTAVPALAATIHLPSTPQTVNRGVISPDIPAVLKIKSGDTVVIDTVSHSGLTPDPVSYFEKAGIPEKDVLKDAIAISKMTQKDWGLGALRSTHVLTGPIYVDGAEPGDMLEVRVIDVSPRVPYGANGAGAGGAAPGMMPATGGKIIKYDIAKRMVNFAPNVKFPMRPFMGIMAVAMPKAISSKAPGLFGGNMDFQKLQAGSTLYLPVQVKGALFVTGDPHAAQGDGEVSGNALEASMMPTLQFIIHKGAGKEMTNPYVEDKDNFYILGQDPDLDKALSSAIKETVKFLGVKYGLKAQDAYSLCSTAVDFGLAQAVDDNLTMYGTISKSWFKTRTPYWR
jgi:acetamidase/formamidase